MNPLKQHPPLRERQDVSQPGPGMRGWFAVGTLLTLGLALFLFTIAYGVLAGQRTLHRVAAPADVPVTFEHKGKYTLFLEYARSDDSREMDRPEGVEQLTVALERGDGALVPLSPAPESRYVIRRLVGEAMHELAILERGPYMLRAQYPANVDGPEIHLVFKRNYREQVLLTFLRGIGVLAITLLATGSLLFWIGRSRRAATTPASPR